MNQVSYCAVHNTYPEAGEPCWACANPFIQKAYEEGKQSAQQSVQADLAVRCQVMGCMHDGIYSLCGEHAKSPNR